MVKVETDGSALLYATYLGGDGDDVVKRIAVSKVAPGTGTTSTPFLAYVTGSTTSTNFPVVAPFQVGPAEGIDAFVSKINVQQDPVSMAVTGLGLSSSTLVGGAGTDVGTGIDVDAPNASASPASPGGNAYVVLTTDSGSGGTPGSPDLQPARDGSCRRRG